MTTNYAPHIQKFIDKLCREGRVGVGADFIQVINPKSGSPACTKNNFCDNFSLVIPYGGHKIQWDVMFLQNHPDFPPDFIFDDHQFMPDIRDIKSLCDWNPNDPGSFLSVVRELLKTYRKESVSRLEANSRLHFEYTSLLQHTEMPEDDVEVMLVRKNRITSVNFQIRLPVDFSRIPPMFTEENPKEDSAFLTITFQSLDGGKVTPKLLLSPGVESVLSGGSPLTSFPAFPAGGCLMDYVPSVQQFLTEKVDQLVLSFEKRKEYFAAMLSLYGKSVQEYDSEKFSKLSFLLEWNDFFFLLHITVPPSFPQEKPRLQFQSIYSCIRGQPFKFNSTNYPYSPRWTGMQMAEKTKIAILECVSDFQKSSLKDL